MKNKTLLHQKLEDVKILVDSIREYLIDEYGMEDCQVKVNDNGISYSYLNEDNFIDLSSKEMLFICLNYYSKKLKS